MKPIRNFTLYTLHFTLSCAALAAAREKVEPATPARAPASETPAAGEISRMGGEITRAAGFYTRAAGFSSPAAGNAESVLAAAFASANAADIPAILAALPADMLDSAAPEIAATLYAALLKSAAPSLSPAALAEVKREWYERFAADGGSRASWILRRAKTLAERGESTDALRAAFWSTLERWMQEED